MFTNNSCSPKTHTLLLKLSAASHASFSQYKALDKIFCSWTARKRRRCYHTYILFLRELVPSPVREVVLRNNPLLHHGHMSINQQTQQWKAWGQLIVRGLQGAWHKMVPGGQIRAFHIRKSRNWNAFSVDRRIMNNRHPRSFRFSCGLDEKKNHIGRFFWGWV